MEQRKEVEVYSIICWWNSLRHCWDESKRIVRLRWRPWFRDGLFWFTDWDYTACPNNAYYTFIVYLFIIHSIWSNRRFGFWVLGPRCGFVKVWFILTVRPHVHIQASEAVYVHFKSYDGYLAGELVCAVAAFQLMKPHIVSVIDEAVT